VIHWGGGTWGGNRNSGRTGFYCSEEHIGKAQPVNSRTGAIRKHRRKFNGATYSATNRHNPMLRAGATPTRHIFKKSLGRYQIMR